MEKQKRTRVIDDDIKDFIETHAIDGDSSTKIFKELKILLVNEGKNRHPPNVRMIQRIVKYLVIQDKTTPWSMASTVEGIDDRAVLDILAFCVTNFSDTKQSSFTVTEAHWITKVNRAAVGAPEKIIYYLALLYTVAEEKANIDIQTLDRYLAFAPWRDMEHLGKYKRTVIKDKTFKVPLWSILVDQLSKSPFPDPRFTGTENTITKFENEIFERSQKGETLATIGADFAIDPDDIKDIIEKFSQNRTRQ
jgi:hypothetical protein